MKITMAYETELNGKSYKADKTYTVDRDTASVLIWKGLARKAASQPEPQSVQTNERDELNG